MRCSDDRGFQLPVIFSLALMAGALFIPAQGIAAADTACTGDAKVLNAYRTSRGGKPGELEVQLEDEIAVEVKGLSQLNACALAENKEIVLFLNSRRFSAAVPIAQDEAENLLRYELLVRPPVDGAEPDPWKHILGRPRLGVRKMDVSVGLEDGSAIRSDASLLIDPIPNRWFFLWLAIFVGLGGLFAWYIRNTTILRNGITDADAPDFKGSYSLARTQAASWFFFIFAAYLFIGLVTGDYVSSLNGTALGLLAIGGATAIVGGMIDDSGDQNLLEDQRKSMLDEKLQEAAELEALLNPPAPPAAAAAPAAPPVIPPVLTAAERHMKLARLSAVQSQIRKLRGESEGFFRDIVSDANGVSFHRFQMVAWTIVLSIVFVIAVWRDLAMPTFDATLLGLMGLSAGTYLGLKNSEPTTPTH